MPKRRKIAVKFFIHFYVLVHSESFNVKSEQIFFLLHSLHANIMYDQFAILFIDKSDQLETNRKYIWYKDKLKDEKKNIETEQKSDLCRCACVL